MRIATYVHYTVMTDGCLICPYHYLSLGHQPGADLGPVISPAAKERICNLVQSGEDQGAKVGKA